jgi:hypothetical protein
MIALRSGHRFAIPTKTSARLTEFKTYSSNIPITFDEKPDGKDDWSNSNGTPRRSSIFDEGQAYQPA